MRNEYKGLITFVEGYNKPFAEFKEEFSKSWVFNRLIDKKEKEKALKEAYAAATKGNEKPIKKDGNSSGSTKKSKAAKA